MRNIIDSLGATLNSLNFVLSIATSLWDGRFDSMEEQRFLSSPSSTDLLCDSLPCPLGARGDFPGLKWLVRVTDSSRPPSIKIQNCMPPLSRTSCLARCLMKSRDDFALPYSGFSNYDARNMLLKVSGQELSSALSPGFSRVIMKTMWNEHAKWGDK